MKNWELVIFSITFFVASSFGQFNVTGIQKTNSDTTHWVYEFYNMYSVEVKFQGTSFIQSGESIPTIFLTNMDTDYQSYPYISNLNYPNDSTMTFDMETYWDEQTIGWNSLEIQTGYHGDFTIDSLFITDTDQLQLKKSYVDISAQQFIVEFNKPIYYEGQLDMAFYIFNVNKLKDWMQDTYDQMILVGELVDASPVVLNRGTKLVFPLNDLWNGFTEHIDYMHTLYFEFKQNPQIRDVLHGYEYYAPEYMNTNTRVDLKNGKPVIESVVYDYLTGDLVFTFDQNVVPSTGGIQPTITYNDEQGGATDRLLEPTANFLQQLPNQISYKLSTLDAAFLASNFSNLSFWVKLPEGLGISDNTQQFTSFPTIDVDYLNNYPHFLNDRRLYLDFVNEPPRLEWGHFDHESNILNLQFGNQISFNTVNFDADIKLYHFLGDKVVDSLVMSNWTLYDSLSYVSTGYLQVDFTQTSFFSTMGHSSGYSIGVEAGMMQNINGQDNPAYNSDHRIWINISTDVLKLNDQPSIDLNDSTLYLYFNKTVLQNYIGTGPILLHYKDNDPNNGDGKSGFISIDNPILKDPYDNTGENNWDADVNIVIPGPVADEIQLVVAGAWKRWSISFGANMFRAVDPDALYSLELQPIEEYFSYLQLPPDPYIKRAVYNYVNKEFELYLSQPGTIVQDLQEEIWLYPSYQDNDLSFSIDLQESPLVDMGNAQYNIQLTESKADSVEEMILRDFINDYAGIDESYTPSISIPFGQFRNNIGTDFQSLWFQFEIMGTEEFELFSAVYYPINNSVFLLFNEELDSNFVLPNSQIELTANIPGNTSGVTIDLIPDLNTFVEDNRKIVQIFLNTEDAINLEMSPGAYQNMKISFASIFQAKTKEFNRALPRSEEFPVSFGNVHKSFIRKAYMDEDNAHIVVLFNSTIDDNWWSNSDLLLTVLYGTTAAGKVVDPNLNSSDAIISINPRDTVGGVFFDDEITFDLNRSGNALVNEQKFNIWKEQGYVPSQLSLFVEDNTFKTSEQRSNPELGFPIQVHPSQGIPYLREVFSNREGEIQIEFTQPVNLQPEIAHSIIHLNGNDPQSKESEDISLNIDDCFVVERLVTCQVPGVGPDSEWSLTLAAHSVTHQNTGVFNKGYVRDVRTIPALVDAFVEQNDQNEMRLRMSFNKSISWNNLGDAYIHLEGGTDNYYLGSNCWTMDNDFSIECNIAYWELPFAIEDEDRLLLTMPEGVVRERDYPDEEALQNKPSFGFDVEIRGELGEQIYALERAVYMAEDQIFVIEFFNEMTLLQNNLNGSRIYSEGANASVDHEFFIDNVFCYMDPSDDMINRRVICNLEEREIPFNLSDKPALRFDLASGLLTDFYDSEVKNAQQIVDMFYNAGSGFTAVGMVEQVVYDQGTDELIVQFNREVTFLKMDDSRLIVNGSNELWLEDFNCRVDFFNDHNLVCDIPDGYIPTYNPEIELVLSEEVVYNEQESVTNTEQNVRVNVIASTGNDREEDEENENYIYNDSVDYAMEIKQLDNEGAVQLVVIQNEYEIRIDTSKAESESGYRVVTENGQDERLEEGDNISYYLYKQQGDSAAVIDSLIEGESSPVSIFPLDEGSYRLISRIKSIKSSAVLDTFEFQVDDKSQFEIESGQWVMVSTINQSIDLGEVDANTSIFKWDETIPRDILFDKYLDKEFIDSIKIGHAYWVYAGDSNIQVNNVSDSTLENYELFYDVGVEGGWVQIGNPFPFSVSTESFGVKEVFGYDSETGDYTINTVMRPFEGYWMELQESEIVEYRPLPVFEMPNSNGRTLNKFRHFTPYDWAATLRVVASSGLTDENNQFGVNPNAENELDEQDRFELPGQFGDFIQLSFNQSGQSLRSDVRKEVQDYSEWDVTLASSEEGLTQATLYLDEYNDLKNLGYNIAIQSNGSVQTMNSGYLDVEFSKAQNLKLIVSKSSNLEASLERASLVSNYPNPVNRFTNFNFLVNAGIFQGESIELKVYDIHGNLVAEDSFTYNGRSNQSLRWEALNRNGELIESGMYLYQIKVGNQVLHNNLIIQR